MLRFFIKLFSKPSTPAERKVQSWDRYFKSQVEV